MKNNQLKANILLVDDTQPTLRLLTDILTKQGYKVRGVLNGPTALKAARLSPPDLILLDIMMPEMDGYEVCVQLKADERTQDIPVIFISALDETLDKVKAFSIGGVDYVTKPFKAEEVLARIETHLALRNMQKQLERMNTELSEANASLEASNKDLETFAHTVAHGLKNPLTTLLGYCELWEYQNLPQEKLRQDLRRMRQDANKMIDIIEALLLLAGIRNAEIVPVPLDMAEIVTTAQERLSDMIAEFQAQLELPSNWPVAVGYVPWIEEVWVNYLSNAIKYGGQPPSLQLGATALPDNMVQFWVQDNGPGLTPAEQAELFVPFARLTQREVEGHGLGLSIVQRIVQKLGGQVGVESEIGQGSKFYFVLPHKSEK
jgi:two-component system sensor histidine kinase/response regulator